MKNPLRIMFHRLFEKTLGREIDSRMEAMLDRELDKRIDYRRLNGALVFGEQERLSVAPSAIVNNALFNTSSGRILVGEHVFFGHHVSLLTGTHDVTSFGAKRQNAIPADGCDIVIKTGAWVASNATVLGPCVVGEHAVVAAGAVVTEDVAAFTIVGGVPARVIGHVTAPEDGAVTSPGHVANARESSP